MEKKSMNLKKLWMVNWRENKFSDGSGTNDKKKGLLQIKDSQKEQNQYFRMCSLKIQDGFTEKKSMNLKKL